MSRLLCLFFFVITIGYASVVTAVQHQDSREKALSDALDLWREGRFEQLYDSLSHRSGMTRERFVMLLQEASVRPACCHKKLNDFKLINEKVTTAKIFARLGMEGSPGTESRQSREFVLDHEEGGWKVRMTDIKALAGSIRKKK